MEAVASFDTAGVVSEGATAYGPGSPKLLDRIRSAMRARHMSRRTEEAYVFWIRRYVRFHGRRHPATLGAEDVTRFFSNLAEMHRVSASTQNQALSALLFLYRRVLGVDLPWLEGLVRAKRPAHVPVVLSREEVAAVLSRLSGVGWLMAALLYGAGLRLLECLELRVKDVDFARGEIVVRRGKGGRDRRTVLPAAIRRPLATHREAVRAQHEDDVARGAGWVELPHALDRKYPNAGREWAWQWVFPATRTYRHPETGQRRRHHFHRAGPPAPRPGRGDPGRDREARGLPHVPSLVRHTPPGERLRHPDRARTPRPPRRPDDDDLHACLEPRWARAREPRRCAHPGRRKAERAAPR